MNEGARCIEDAELPSDSTASAEAVKSRHFSAAAEGAIRTEIECRVRANTRRAVSDANVNKIRGLNILDDRD